MDLGGKEKIGMEVGNPDHLGYHQMDSFYPPLWDQQPNSLSLGFQDSGNAHNVLVGRPQLDPVSQGGALVLQSASGILPHTLLNFQTDSGFIERAARLTCFGAAGFGSAGSPLGSSPSLDKYLRASIPLKNEVGTGEEASGDAVDVGNSCAHRDESEDADIGGSRSSLNSKDLAAKKRKRSAQSMEIDQMKAESSNPVEYEKVNTESMQKVEQNSSTPEQNYSITAKPNGKQAKDSADPPKADYIHVRARRGQATNSHSLAERVRREKISERMKFLQDLVPGCSKVTGKAVMLDEIINYVQSLQRQVEFLSMKLAAVNPQLDSNVEGILLKDIFQSQADLASSNAFPPDMVLPLLRSNQQALVPSLMSRIARPHFDAHRGAISTQMASLHTYSDPKLQVSNPWDEDIVNAIQMGLMGNPPLSLQEINEKNCGRFPT